jgi:hypothetical protein
MAVSYKVRQVLEQNEYPTDRLELVLPAIPVRAYCPVNHYMSTCRVKAFSFGTNQIRSIMNHSRLVECKNERRHGSTPWVRCHRSHIETKRSQAFRRPSPELRPREERGIGLAGELAGCYYSLPDFDIRDALLLRQFDHNFRTWQLGDVLPALADMQLQFVGCYDLLSVPVVSHDSKQPSSQ